MERLFRLTMRRCNRPASQNETLFQALDYYLRVRAAAVGAMSNFLGHRALIDTLIKTLHDDPGYAVQAAAARQLGRSGDEDAFNALHSEAQSSLQEIVAMGALDGLAASKNSQAAQILLGYAQPGTPERVREHALSDLPQLKGELQ